MIHIVQGFKLFTRDPVDWRLTLTKAEMRSVNDNQMPDKYFTICKDDGLLYIYDKSNQCDCENGTGKFRAYSSEKIESISINGEIIPIDPNGNIEFPIMSKTQFGVGKAGNGLNVDNGTISVDFNAAEDHSISVSKIDFGELIIDANG